VPFLEQYKENVGQYMDDWWIATADDVEGRALHEEAIHAFLSTCEEKSYFLKAFKCEIMWSQITLLGWLVTGEGLCIDPSKVTVTIGTNFPFYSLPGIPEIPKNPEDY